MAGTADKIYKCLPVPLQHAIVSAYGYYWKRLRFGGKFEYESAQFKQRERYTAEQWRLYTEDKLRELLVSAFEHVPHYQQTWKTAGITLAELSRFRPEDITRLPLLEKSVARETPHALLLNGRPTKQHLVFHTSGSTGTPVASYWLPSEMQRSLALRETRSCGFAGVSYRLPRATFSGRIVEPDPNSKGPYYRFNLAERQVYFSAFHLRPDTVIHYAEALRRHKIVWMTGYSNSIFQLASMILDQGIKAPKLEAVITTSEKLTTQMREVIREAFHTSVFEEYGTVEDLFYVCECEAGSKHINPDAGLIEIVDEQYNPVPPGTVGEVLATGFIRPSQPMIRYRIGDRAVLSEKPCACGRHMPVLEEIIGRLEDTVYGPDGRRMVRFHGIFTDQPHIREGQIIQERLDLIRVRVVPQEGFDQQDVQDITQRIHQRLSEKVSVVVETTDHIERTASGKFRAVISNLSPEERARAEGIRTPK